MIKSSAFLLGLSILILAAISCEKHTVIPAPDSTLTLSELTQQYLDDKTQTFTVDATISQTIYGNQGTQIELTGNNFTDLNGDPIIGLVEIKLIELYTLSAMILANKATLANQGGQIVPLSSGGEFSITVTQAGNPVLVANPLNVITAPVQNPVSNMQLFGGIIDNKGDMLWDLDTSTSVAVVPNTNSFGYSLPWIGDYEWMNCDYFYSSSSPQTSVSVNLPSYDEMTYTKVFLAFPGDMVLAQLYADASGGFTTYGYTLPIGATIHTVAITVHQDQLKYAIQESTIGSNHVVNFTNMTNVNSINELETILEEIL